MTEPRVRELEQGHPWADDFTAWHSKQAQLFQLTPRAHAARLLLEYHGPLPRMPGPSRSTLSAERSFDADRACVAVR